ETGHQRRETKQENERHARRFLTRNCDSCSTDDLVSRSMMAVMKRDGDPSVWQRRYVAASAGERRSANATGVNSGSVNGRDAALRRPRTSVRADRMPSDANPA